MLNSSELPAPACTSNLLFLSLSGFHLREWERTGTDGHPCIVSYWSDRLGTEGVGTVAGALGSRCISRHFSSCGSVWPTYVLTSLTDLTDGC